MYNPKYILADLIAFKTDATVLSNKDMIDYICRFFDNRNILYKRILNDESHLENLVAGINVNDWHHINTGLVLSGHMDTVSANLKKWQTNPYQAVYRDNCLYGRGTVDMKYFIAVVLSILDELKHLQMPVFLVFTCDEETAAYGIQHILSFFKENNIQPQYALVGEPTHFELGYTHRGYLGYTTNIKGISAHASMPRLGVNAIYIASQISSYIESLNHIYEPQGTTLNVGTIQGGVGRNSIPNEAFIEWEIRSFEKKHQEHILEEINQFHQNLLSTYKGAEIVLKKDEVFPLYQLSQNSTIFKLGKDILKTNGLNLPYTTEAGFLQEYGIETLICGAGDEKLAHTSCEYIQIEDLYKYRNFLISFIQKLEELYLKEIK